MPTTLDVEQEPKRKLGRPPSLANFSDIGFTGLKEWMGRIDERLIPELKGPKFYRVMKEMSLMDPITGAILFSISMMIRQTPWRVKPGTGADAEKAAELLDSCRDDMSQTWSDVMTEILTMLPYGWAYLEIVYKKREGTNRDPSRNSRFNDGLIGWRKLPLRAQSSLDFWNMDPAGGIHGMHQKTIKGQSAYIPIEKALLFRTESTMNNPEGRSIFINAYRPWLFKKRIEELEGIGIERDLAGLPVLTTPENLDIWNPNDAIAQNQKQEAENLVRNIRRDEQEGVVLPFGWTLTLLGSTGKRNFDTTTVVGRYNNMIAMTVMADFIILGHNNRYGSKALAGNKTAMFQRSITGWLDSIQEVLNRYAVPRLMLVNGLSIDDPPQFQHGEVTLPDLAEVGQFLERLARAGMKIFPNEVLEKQMLINADIDTEGVKLGQEAAPLPMAGAFGEGDDEGNPDRLGKKPPPDQKAEGDKDGSSSKNSK